MWLGPPGLPFDTFDPEAQAMIVQKWYEGKQHGPGSSRQQQIQDHSHSVPDRHNHHQVVFPGGRNRVRTCGFSLVRRVLYR